MPPVRAGVTAVRWPRALRCARGRRVRLACRVRARTGAKVLDDDIAAGDDLLLLDTEVSLRLKARGQRVKVHLRTWRWWWTGWWYGPTRHAAVAVAQHATAMHRARVSRAAWVINHFIGRRRRAAGARACAGCVRLLDRAGGANERGAPLAGTPPSPTPRAVCRRARQKRQDPAS